MKISEAKRLSKRLVISVLCVAAVGAGCMFFPGIPQEDDGDYAYVRQIKPILQGSKIRGREEVKLLSDIIQATSREILLRALMEQTEFVDHWSEVLVDDLRIAREGSQSQRGCFGSPARGLPDSGELADSVINNLPQSTAPGGDFNMSDLVRSAVTSGNLYPLYRAHLYSQMNRLPAATDEIGLRDILGAQFAENYLNRQMGCIICHNSEYSMSDEVSGWNRTFPILGLFEKALFGSSSGEPTKDAYAVFRSDNRIDDSDTQIGDLRPWGVQNCGQYETALMVDPQNVTAQFVQTQGKRFGVHALQSILHSGYLDLRLNGLGRTLPPGIQATCDFCNSSCQGVTLSTSAAANNATNAMAVKAIMSNNSSPTGCRHCHGGTQNLYFTTGDDWANDVIGVDSTQKTGETRVIPGNANDSYLIKKLENHSGIVGGQMPLGGGALSSDQINIIKVWINDLSALTTCASCESTDCGQLAREVQGHESFAYLLAARIVDNVWEEVMGYPVTIANYFPRNYAQRQILWNLTEYNLIPNDYSLKDLLVRILTSNFFNRKPPRTTASTNAYNLPPVLDPWIALDPRVPPVSDPGYSAAAHPQNNKNAMSEGIYRYSARSLTNSVHKALDWPEPDRFPPNSGYPDQNLMRSIGFFFSDRQPGFQTSDFQGLLAWETVHGRCQKPVGVTVDWINKVVDKVNVFPRESPGGVLTVKDVAVVLRDWLLGHGKIESVAPVGVDQTEEQALARHFGVGSVSDPVSSVANLEQALRDYCGTLLETAQFWLAGFAVDELDAEPRLRVCNTSDCTYEEMCEALKPAIEAQFQALPGATKKFYCHENSVSVYTLGSFSPDSDKSVAELCPPNICGAIKNLINPGCSVMEPPADGGKFGPQLCLRQPPACNPTCTRIDCCSGPLPPDFSANDLLVAWAEGAEVLQAVGIRVLPKGAASYKPLIKGIKVGFGDLIAISPGSRFLLRTADGDFLRTPKEGFARRRDQPTIMMMISGPQALQVRRPDVAEPKAIVPKALISRILQSPWARHGEGGIPLSNERRRGYVYSDEELGLEDLLERGLLSDELLDYFRKQGKLK